MFIIYALISGTALILFKIAMNERVLAGNNMFQSFLSIKFITGLLLYAFSFLMFMFILSKFKLNLAYPVATAIFFVYISLASYFILKEPISVQHIIGIVFCVLGVALIGLK